MALFDANLLLFHAGTAYGLTAGEFVNMVTGAWLTATDATSVFDLTAPAVARVETAPGAPLLMQINGQPVGLVWRVE